MISKQSLPRAFANAFNGIRIFFIQDRNGKIHLAAAIIVILTAYELKVTVTEWLVLLLCIALVICLEMINAAIERLCDVAHKDFHASIKFIKDVSAAAVLVASIISLIIGFIIFIPKIIALI